MKSKLHIELLRACYHPQRVLCPIPAPGPSLRDAVLAGKCLRAGWVLWAGCLARGYHQLGGIWGKFSVLVCHPDTFPGWNGGSCPKAVGVFCWGWGLWSDFCVCLLRCFIVPQMICELLFGNICFRTVIELTSGKYFVWKSLDSPFDLGYRSRHWAEMASPTFV